MASVGLWRFLAPSGGMDLKADFEDLRAEQGSLRANFEDLRANFEDLSAEHSRAEQCWHARMRCFRVDAERLHPAVGRTFYAHLRAS